jgi:ABC-2 type transport system permease protein/sodium transport system permease protein
MRLGRLARKELSESLRDRRTLLTLVLMPLFLYPVLGLLVWLFPPESLTVEAFPVYRIACRNEDEGKAIRNYLDAGADLLVYQGIFLRPPGDAPTPPPPAFPALPLPELKFFAEENIEEHVRQGTVDVALRLRTPGPFLVSREQNLAVNWDVLYREDSATGREAVRHVQRLCEAANKRFLGERLWGLGVPQRPTPVQMKVTAVPSPEVRQTPAFLTLVPLVLILMTITGAVYPAIDLTAGERERGTLEILMAAPLPRLSVLLAKYTAVLAVAMLTALMNLGSMAATLLVLASASNPKSMFGEVRLSPLLLAEVLGLLLLFAAFFSAVLLALTSFARSFKEAQVYLIPLFVLSLIPGTLSLVPGLHLGGVLLLVPLLNTVLLARDLLAGDAEPLAAAVVVVSTLAYALGAIAVAARLFGVGAVRGHGGWFDGRGGRRGGDPA